MTRNRERIAESRNIARAHGITPLLFQLLQKLQNERGLEIAHTEGAGSATGRLVQEGQKQTKRIATTSNGMRTGTLLGAQILDKERLEMRSKKPRSCRQYLSPFWVYA